MTDRIKETVRDAIVKGAFEAAKSPDTATQGSDVNVITSKVLTEVAPIVAHATNNEPWYQSRVTLGAILAALAGILSIFGYAFPAEMQGKVIDLVLASAPLIGGALALYGRWVAKKPIGQ